MISVCITCRNDQEEKDRYDELVEERLEMVAARNWLMRKCKE